LKRLLASTAIVFSVLAITGCQSTTSRSTNTTSATKNKEEATEVKVKKEGRAAVADFQKVFYEVGDIDFDSYNELLQHYGLTEAEQKAFYKFMDDNQVEGSVLNVLFNNLSEKVKKQPNGDYMYQVTTEAQVKNLTDISNHYVTYVLIMKPTVMGNYKVYHVAYEVGHSLEGVDSKIARIALDEVIEEKLDKLFSNGFKLNTKKDAIAKQNINSLFLHSSSVSSVIERFNFSSKTNNTFLGSELLLSEKQVDEDGYGAYGVGTYTISYKDDSNKEKKEEYEVFVTLKQRNPLEEDYMYVIDGLTIKKK